MYCAENMQPSQIYLVMVIAIRKYQICGDKEDLLKILLLVNNCKNSVNDTCVYGELLESFIYDFSKEYIDYRLEDMDVEPYNYDEFIRNFKVLRECGNDNTLFLTTVESQLQGFAYRETSAGDLYEENVKIAIDYMLREKELYSSMVYKNNGIVLREKFVFIKPVIDTLEIMRQKQLIL
jgi:hypothetical protein